MNGLKWLLPKEKLEELENKKHPKEYLNDFTITVHDNKEIPTDDLYKEKRFGNIQEK